MAWKPRRRRRRKTYGERDGRNPRYRRWRKRVLDRDGNKCTVCGAVVDLHVHHVKGWTAYPLLRFVTENGVTYCGACHRKWHSEHGHD